MLNMTPQEAASLVLTYHVADVPKVSAQVLAAINGAGYAIVDREKYIGTLTELAGLALSVPPRVAG